MYVLVLGFAIALALTTALLLVAVLAIGFLQLFVRGR